MEDHFRSIIECLGEDTGREGLLETPSRAARTWRDWTNGYTQQVEDILTVFEDGCPNNNEIIFIKDIPMYSHCEHHLAPFFGSVSVGYIPNRKVVGLSKVSRIIDMFAKRLQVQERLTEEIAEALYSGLGAKAVGVRVVARHLCMESRGICKQNSQTTTTSTRGSFLPLGESRGEFLRGIL